MKSPFDDTPILRPPHGRLAPFDWDGESATGEDRLRSMLPMPLQVGLTEEAAKVTLHVGVGFDVTEPTYHLTYGRSLLRRIMSNRPLRGTPEMRAMLHYAGGRSLSLQDLRAQRQEQITSIHRVTKLLYPQLVRVRSELAAPLAFIDADRCAQVCRLPCLQSLMTQIAEHVTDIAEAPPPALVEFKATLLEIVREPAIAARIKEAMRCEGADEGGAAAWAIEVVEAALGSLTPFRTLVTKAAESYCKLLALSDAIESFNRGESPLGSEAWTPGPEPETAAYWQPVEGHEYRLRWVAAKQASALLYVLEKLRPSLPGARQELRASWIHDFKDVIESVDVVSKDAMGRDRATPSVNWESLRVTFSVREKMQGEPDGEQWPAAVQAAQATLDLAADQIRVRLAPWFEELRQRYSV